MDRVEEVKKILDKRYSRYKELLAHQEGTAEEICQLFELPEGEPPLLSDKCDHIFERHRLDMRRCIECGLEQLRYIDAAEPLRWVDSPKG